MQANKLVTISVRSMMFLKNSKNVVRPHAFFLTEEIAVLMCVLRAVWVPQATANLMSE